MLHYIFFSNLLSSSSFHFSKMTPDIEDFKDFVFSMLMTHFDFIKFHSSTISMDVKFLESFAYDLTLYYDFSSSVPYSQLYDKLYTVLNTADLTFPVHPSFASYSSRYHTLSFINLKFVYDSTSSCSYSGLPKLALSFSVDKCYDADSSNYCCYMRCFAVPDIQVDGIACRKCKHFSYCVCNCLRKRI